MKNKKLIIALIAAAVAVTVLTVGMFHLFGGDAGIGAAANITLSQQEAVVGVGGTLYLTAETDTGEDVVWASSDPEVAEVREGEVTGLKEGSVVISASVGRARAECQVTVSTDAPALTVNDEYVVVSIGSSYTLKPQVAMNGQPYTQTPVDYRWTAAEGSETYVSLQAADDGTAVVTGVAYGDAWYYVSTQVNGVSLTKKVMVVCCDTATVLNAQGQGIQPAVGGFDLELELGTTIRPQVSVYTNDQKVANPKLTWSSDKTAVATVSANGTITAVKEGTAIITARYGDKNNQIRFFVNVFRPVYNMTTHYTLEAAAGRFTITDKLVGTITDVSVNGKSILGSVEGNTIVFKPGSMPTSAALMGEGRPLVIDTDRAKYVYSASVYSKIITTADEFKQMGTYMTRKQGDNNWAMYDGYVVLGKNIDLQGAAFEMFTPEPFTGAQGGADIRADLGFNGVFDGKGYTVSNYTATAGHNTLFTTVGQSGVIKNVSFTDVSAPATAGNILTRLLNGKLQNVYISLKSWENGALLAHSYRDGRLMENVVIEYTGPEIDGVRDLVGHWGTPPNYFVHYPLNIKNVYVIGNISQIVTNCAEHGSQSCGFHVYENLAQMQADKNSYAAFPKSFWNLDSGLPVPQSIYDQRAGVSISVSNTEKLLSAGDRVTLRANVEYVTWKLDKAPKGVTLQGNVLTVAKDASLGDVKVTATNVFSSAKTDSVTFQVVKMSNQRLASLGDLELNATKGQTEVTLDLSQATAFTQVAGIKIGDKEIPVKGVSGSQVTVEAADLKSFLGKSVEIVFTCKTSGGYNKVTLPATVVSKVISTAAEFKAMADYMDRSQGDNNWAQYTGYLVLGKDIDLEGSAFELFAAEAWSGTGGNDNKANMGFNGTLDGRGYTVSGYQATAGNNALFTVIGQAGLIRNVNFVDITAPSGTGNILTRIFNGKLQDVYISLQDWKAGNLLNHSYRDGRFLENVVIEYTGAPIDGLRDVTGHWGDANYFVHYPANIQNVYILGDITTIVTNCAEHGADQSCGFHVFQTLEEMKAAGNDYSGFSSADWNTSTGMPVPAKLYKKWSNTDITVTNQKVDGQYELIKGNSMDLTANASFVTWELVGNTDSKITLEGNKLTAQADATADQVTVKATNRYNSGKTAQITVKLVSSQSKTLTALSYLELKATSGQTHVYVDLQESQTVSAITAVSINGKSAGAGTFSLDSNRLQLSVSQLQEYLGKGVTLEISYKIPGTNVVASCQVGTVVTKAIKTFADLNVLNSVATPNLDGYFILAADINANNQDIAAGSSWGSGFRGTFDGKGHTISNLKLGASTAYSGAYSGIFGAVNGGTIKNITFDNVSINHRAAIFGRVMGNLAGTTQKTTVENVTVNISAWAQNATECAVFAWSQMANTKYVNVVVNVADGITVPNLLGQQYNAGNVEGSVVVNLGVESSITHYCWTGDKVNTAVTTVPAIVTVNKSVVEQIDTLVAAENTTTVTFTNKNLAVGDVNVTINGQSKTVAVTTAGKLTVDLSDFGVTNMGKYVATITSGKSKYTFTDVWYVTQVIDNAAELKALSAKCKAANTTGYYILGADINCSAEANMAAGTAGWMANGFSGTFDGRGKTISNIKMTWDSATGGYGGLFSNLAGCTIQNVVFDKVNYASVNTSLLGRLSYASGGNNVNLKNLTINVSGWGAGAGQEIGVLLSKNMQNTITTNVVVNVADNLTITTLLGADCSSIAYVTMTVNLGTNSKITYYYGTTSVKPATITVNGASEPVEETLNTLVAAENTTSLTIQNSAFTAGSATVTLNGQTKSATVATAGKLTVNLADFGVSKMGKYTAVVETAEGKWTYNEVWYVTQVIDDVAELKALGTQCKNSVVTGYYILGGNIDCSAQATMSNGSGSTTTNGFSGTFDGRNKTISNIKMTWDSATSGLGGLFGKLLGCTIKDTVFDKVNLGTNGTLLASGADKNATTNANTTLQNLTVNLSGYSTVYGVMVGYSMFNTVGNGIVINVADGLTVAKLMARDNCNSIGYIYATVNLGTGSTITNYYSTTTAVPSTFTVNKK